MVEMTRRMASLAATVLLLAAWAVSGTDQKADLVRVDKGRSRLELLRDGEVLESFPVVFGANPRGHKLQQGDERTPEGRYILDSRNPESAYYRSIHISYPNPRDREDARRRGVDPGGDIMIHGQPNGWEWLETVTQLFNWTDGCIALRNRDMDVVWSAVDPGTPIEITP
jgi:murein L,D-transpeptidase YafK